ncbi:MAG: response regulator [Desulfobacteraceae bacterium]|nr:response regulator [Desulfobacteraceae bacterium]
MTLSSEREKAAILYVDDDKENLTSFKAVLRREYNIHLANSAREALDILKRSQIQVLITDQRMPDMTGSELLGKASQMHPDLSCFMLTGFSDFDPLVEAINLGRLQGYFTKPMNITMIKNCIENCLSAYYLKLKNEELNRALKLSEANLRSIFNQAAVGIAAIESNGRFLMVNKKLCDMFSCRQEDLLEITLYDIMSGDNFLPGSGQFKALLENTVSSFQVEDRCRCFNDEHIWCSLTLSTVANSGSETDSLIVIVEDITARKKAEKQAHEAQSFTENLIHTANALIVSLDKDGLIQLVNPAVEKTTGYSHHELIGKNWFDLVVPRETYSWVWLQFCKLATGGIPKQIENPIRSKNGAERIISWSNSELKHDDAVVGTLSVGIDITERTVAEKEKDQLLNQLQQSQKMEAIGTLAGGIAHDFNNILSPIIGYAELIKSDTEPESENNLSARQILNAGLRARDLVNQILTFSRKRDQEKIPIKIQPIINEAVKLLRASFPSTVTIDHQIGDMCGPIMGDSTQIYQVIVNLCTNASQALQDQKGHIKLVVEETLLTDDDMAYFVDVTPGLFVRVSVTDDGPGIDPDIMERIFDPYFTTKQMKSGTGLGLSVVHGIVKGHSGTVKVYSELDEGTCFNVYFPRIVDDKSKLVISEGKHVPCGNESILLIDDEDSLVTVVQKILENLGYKVTSFTDSRSALAYFKLHPDVFDLIISDMTMPHLSGEQLAEAILAERPHKPIIICTGFSELVCPNKSAKTGIRRVVVKPIVKNEIAVIIREILDEY